MNESERHIVREIERELHETETCTLARNTTLAKICLFGAGHVVGV